MWSYRRHQRPGPLRGLFGTVNAPLNLPPSWNLAPTQTAPVIRLEPGTDTRHMDALRWGLVAHFTRNLKAAPRPINARCETAGGSSMFRGALASKRCLVPADAFYEWRAMADGKQPYAIARTDGAPLAFARLWEGWRAPDGEVWRTFAILTKAANAKLPRMASNLSDLVAFGALLE